LIAWLIGGNNNASLSVVHNMPQSWTVTLQEATRMRMSRSNCCECDDRRWCNICPKAGETTLLRPDISLYSWNRLSLGANKQT